MGLASIEVMQAMQRTWTNSKVRVNGKTRQLQWRDMFDIAVKWRRYCVLEGICANVVFFFSFFLKISDCLCAFACLCRIADPDQPVLWLDQMPEQSLSRGFNNHINLIRCYSTHILYLTLSFIITH